MTARILLLMPVLLGSACTEPVLPATEPVQGTWAKEFFDFNHADGQITELRIGGEGYDDNFINRGDITVSYDADPNSMVVEWRPFADAAGEAEARLARLEPWFSSQSFVQPQPVDGTNECIGMWREGCGIRAYYDGEDQSARSGIDFHVHLPPDFVGKLDIFTQDNDIDDDYRNRGNVCLWDLPGSADVRVEQGLVFAKLADSLQTTPTCPADEIAACEDQEWATSCPCLANGHGFGQLDIQGVQSDIVVDTTPGVWTKFTAESPSPQSEQTCVAAIDVPGAVLNPGDDTTDASGHVNEPPDVPAGLGYAVRAVSDKCDSTHYVESPDMFVRGNQGPLDRRRGDITICEDCIQASSCAEVFEGAFRAR